MLSVHLPSTEKSAPLFYAHPLYPTELDDLTDCTLLHGMLPQSRVAPFYAIGCDTIKFITSCNFKAYIYFIKYRRLSIKKPGLGRTFKIIVYYFDW